MSTLSRREFLHNSTLLAAAAAALGPTVATADEAKPAKKVGPNDRIRVACIGFHGQGKTHLGSFSSMPDTIITTICDVDSSLAADGIKRVEDKQHVAPKFVQDLRRIMEDKSIDVVSIATPNHWHALAAIWAIQAGKDVYVEKPVSHNVWEGRRIVDIARQKGRIVQTGTQSRSNTGMREALDYIHGGKIGKVSTAYGLCYKSRPSIGPRKEAKIPDGVDYDLWCGPAEVKPSYRNGIHGPLHYDWHWFWDYGNGDLGNQGIHEMDKARWGLNKQTLPTRVASLGGRFGYEDAGETANTQVCFFDYGDAQLIFEVRGLPTKDFKGAKVGNIWQGENGYVVSPNYDSAVAYSPDGQIVEKFKGGASHYANFIKAVKSRQHADLNADIEDGHLSSALCHLGNISYRLPMKSQGDGLKMLLNLVAKDLPPQMQDSLTRMLDHLKQNKVEEPALHVGSMLKFDPKTERFLDHEEANKLLTREYRKGFEVPAKG